MSEAAEDGDIAADANGDPRRSATIGFIPTTFARVREGMLDAVQMFGNAGAALIPVLNAGADAMHVLQDEFAQRVAAAAAMPAHILFGFASHREYLASQAPPDAPNCRCVAEPPFCPPVYGPVQDFAIELEQALDVALDVREIGGDVALILRGAAPFLEVLRCTRMRPWARQLESADAKSRRAMWATPPDLARFVTNVASWAIPATPSQITSDIATMIESIRNGVSDPATRTFRPAVVSVPRHGRTFADRMLREYRDATSFGAPVFVNPPYRDARSWVERAIQDGAARIRQRAVRLQAGGTMAMTL